MTAFLFQILDEGSGRTMFYLVRDLPAYTDQVFKIEMCNSVGCVNSSETRARTLLAGQFQGCGPFSSKSIYTGKKNVLFWPLRCRISAVHKNKKIAQNAVLFIFVISFIFTVNPCCAVQNHSQSKFKLLKFRVDKFQIHASISGDEQQISGCSAR